MTTTPAPRTTDADRARADAHAARRAADAARNANHRARYNGADARTLRTGIELLGGILASPMDMSTHIPENALHNEDGSVSTPLLVEFLAELANGYWPHEILENLNQRRQDEFVYGPAETSARHWHAWADALTARAEHGQATPMPAAVQPALPPSTPPVPESAEAPSAMAAAENFIKDALSDPSSARPQAWAPPADSRRPSDDPMDTQAMLKRIDPNMSPEKIATMTMRRIEPDAPRAEIGDTATMDPIADSVDPQQVSDSVADQGPRPFPETSPAALAVGSADANSADGEVEDND